MRCFFLSVAAFSMSILGAPASQLQPHDPTIAELSKQEASSVAQSTPMRSLGEPEKASPTAYFLLSENSLVILDGKSCRYDQVSDDAVIVYVELAADARTILQIHFRTR